jgi:hypothetical protein
LANSREVKGELLDARGANDLHYAVSVTFLL